MAKLVPVSDLVEHKKLGSTDLLPALTEAEYDGLRESIRADGIVQPLVVTWPEKVVLDGHHRLRIARELGIAEVPIVTEEFKDEAGRIQPRRRLREPTHGHPHPRNPLAFHPCLSRALLGRVPGLRGVGDAPMKLLPGAWLPLALSWAWIGLLLVLAWRLGAFS